MMTFFLGLINFIAWMIFALSIVLVISIIIGDLIVEGFKKINIIYMFKQNYKKIFAYSIFSLLLGLLVITITNSNYNFVKIRNEANNEKIESFNESINKQNKIQKIRFEQKELYKKLYQTKDSNEKAKLHVEIDKNNQEINNLNN